MTELLTREKQYYRLNAELNRMANAKSPPATSNTAAINESQTEEENERTPRAQNIIHHQFHPNAPQALRTLTISNARNDRFSTYTKSKGCNSTLRKRGAGDAGPDSVAETNSIAEKPGKSNLPNQRQARIRVGNSLQPPPQPAPSLVTAIGQHGRNDNRESANESARSSNAEKNSARHRRNEQNTRTTSRIISNRANYNINGFSVRYRNPRFVESPSLEVLVRDERTSIKQKRQKNPNLIKVTSEIEEIMSTNCGGNIKKQISAEGIVKFLKSKIEILEQDNERLIQEMAAQKELLEKTIERHKKTEQQRDQAYTKHNTMAEQLTKVETQLDEAQKRNREHHSESTTHQKELEIARRELKILAQTNTNLEKRLYRATEELENAKNALTLMKNTEREIRENSRLEREMKDKQIRNLKKQRSDLLNAYKKQLFLIDNLKRQNLCMEQSKLVGFNEKEFTRALDWNSK